MAALKNEVLFVSVKDKFDDDTIVLKNFNEITQIVKKLNKKLMNNNLEAVSFIIEPLKRGIYL